MLLTPGFSIREIASIFRWGWLLARCTIIDLLPPMNLTGDGRNAHPARLHYPSATPDPLDESKQKTAKASVLYIVQVPTQMAICTPPCPLTPGWSGRRQGHGAALPAAPEHSSSTRPRLVLASLCLPSPCDPVVRCRSIDVDAAKATVLTDKDMILKDIVAKHGSTQVRGVRVGG